MPRSANPDDELDRSLYLHCSIYLLTPRVGRQAGPGSSIRRVTQAASAVDRSDSLEPGSFGSGAAVEERQGRGDDGQRGHDAGGEQDEVLEAWCLQAVVGLGAK